MLVCSSPHPNVACVCAAVAAAAAATPAAQIDSKLSPQFEKVSSTSKPHFALFLNGEQLEIVEGVNAPLLEKFINDYLPDGEVENDGGDGGDEEED